MFRFEVVAVFPIEGDVLRNRISLEAVQRFRFPSGVRAIRFFNHNLHLFLISVRRSVLRSIKGVVSVAMSLWVFSLSRNVSPSSSTLPFNRFWTRVFAPC